MRIVQPYAPGHCFDRNNHGRSAIVRKQTYDFYVVQYAIDEPVDFLLQVSAKHAVRTRKFLSPVQFVKRELGA
jgi:hypothetical protein